MKENLFKKLKKGIGQFLVREQGAIAIITGLLFVVLIGFAALAIDASFWYSDRRQLQLAADAGAVGGAIALKTTGKSTINTYATNNIQRNNSDCAAGGSQCNIVAINNPPDASSTNAGNLNAVQVILSKPATMFLSGLFLDSTPTLQVQAVAGVQPSNYCIVSLATSGTGINIGGGATINTPYCGLYSNAGSSTNSKSIILGGNSIVTTTNISAVGGITNNGATITQGVQLPQQPSVADPYAGVQMPSPGTCTSGTTNYKLGNNQTDTISPGTYCGGISLNGASTLTMQPGVYFMVNQGNKGGNFSISSQGIVSATGVTIIMTSLDGATFGKVNINAGASLTMSPTTTGATSGILFFGDRRSSGLSEKFDGGIKQLLSGALYFPTNNLDYAGKSTITGNPCFQMVAYTISFTGSSGLGNNCAALGLGNISLLE